MKHVEHDDLQAANKWSCNFWIFVKQQVENIAGGKNDQAQYHKKPVKINNINFGIESAILRIFAVETGYIDLSRREKLKRYSRNKHKAIGKAGNPQKISTNNSMIITIAKNDSICSSNASK